MLTRLFNKKPKKIWIAEFDKTKSIFIHIPKAAGTSISFAIYGRDPWHYPAQEYQRFYKKQFSRYFTFAFVRKPFDRILSTYLYSFVQTKRHPSTSVAFLTKYSSFEEFVLDWIKKENIMKHYFFLPQKQYVTDEHGKIIIDFIGRFETIDDDFLFVKNKLYIDGKLENKNKTAHEHYQSYYSNEMKGIIEEVYSDDLSYFSYKFQQKYI